MRVMGRSKEKYGKDLAKNERMPNNVVVMVI